MRSSLSFPCLGLLLPAGCYDGFRSAELPSTSGDAVSASSGDAVDGSSGGPGPGTHATMGEGAGDETGLPPEEMPTDGFLDGFFPIGVFGQPAYTMEGWQSVGCNTMLGTPQGENLGAWDDEAQRLGMMMIRAPVGAPSEDVGRTDLLAWLLPDEPDVEANNAPCGGNCVSLIESMSASWRAADPDRKIFVNVAGPNVVLAWGCDYCNGPGDDPPTDGCNPDNAQCYPRIIETSDWISQDIYPVTGWLPAEDLRDDITVVGRTLDRLADWTDKPRFAIIEISDQRLGFDGTGLRGPTPEEYRAEIWHAIIHGAHGIFYFPQAFNPFEYEAVEPDVLDEMIVQHERITGLAPLIQSEADPADIVVQVGAPLEATWRKTEGTVWVFVLNTSDQPGTGAVKVEGVAADAEVYDEGRSLSFVDGGFTDEFAPYDVHVYALPRD